MIGEEEESFNNIDKYRLIIENINDLIFIIKHEIPFKIKFINERNFLNTLQFSNHDLIGTSLLDYIHQDNISNFKRILKKGENEEDDINKIRIRNKNNHYFWFEYKLKRFKDHKNKKKLLLILKNISKIKQLEEKFEENEVKLKNLMKSIPEIRFWKLFYPKKYEEALKISYEMFQKAIDNIPENIFWKDCNLVYLGCNQNYAKLIKITTPENVIGEKDDELLLDKLLTEKKVKELREKELEILNSGQPEFHIEELWNLKNGEKIWFDTNRIALYDSEKNIAGILVTYEDITELKRAEEDLKESEEKFRTISEKSLLGILIIQDDIIKYINQVAIRRLEYTKDEMKSWKKDKYLQLFIPEEREIIAKLTFELQKGLKSSNRNLQIRCVTKSGEIMWIEVFGQSIHYRGNPAALITAVDITRRRKAEEQLIESEEKYRHLFESSPNMICLIDINRKIIDFNTALINFLGMEREYLKNKDFLEIYNFSKENLMLMDSKYKELLKKGIIKPFEIQIFLENNKSYWFNIQASFIETGIKTLIEVIIQDITDRKRSEEIVQLNELRLEALFKLSKMSDLSENEIIDFAVVKATELTKSKMGCIFLINKEDSTLRFISCTNKTENSYYIKKENNFSSNEMQMLRELLKQPNPIINNNYLEDNNLFTCLSNTEEELKRYLWIPITEGENIVATTCMINKEDNYNELDVDQLTLFMDGVWGNIQRKRAKEALKKSEGKYRNLIETSSMGILEYDFNINNITYVNPKLLTMLEYDEEKKFFINYFLKNIYPEDLNQFYKISDKNQLEFRIYNKYGDLKWFLGKFIHQYDKNGKIKSFRLWLEDITEKRLYEELIYELNVNFLNFTTQIQKNIEMLISTCCKLLNATIVLYVHKRIQDGKVLFQFMDSEKRIYYHNDEEFKEKFFISEFFGENHDYIQTFYNLNDYEYFKTDPYLINYNLMGCHGKLIKSQNEYNSAICVFYKKNPIISHQDKLVLFLLCDAIEIEQRRWKVQQDLEEQNKLKTELLSRTSHELKTPLISIKGFTELLLTVHKASLDTDMISILHEIKEGSHRLEKLVKSLLESSRLDQNQLKLNITTEDLSFLIKFCVKELQPLAELRNQTIKLNIHEYLTCNFDKERIYEVMSNLLLNALKYTPPGGEIKINTEIKKKKYIISVEDTGIGITDEEKEQLFKQFGKIERYGKGWDVDIEGSGLGLYISKKIVELHKGKIWVESEGRNKGSKFYFSLPII